MGNETRSVEIEQRYGGKLTDYSNLSALKESEQAGKKKDGEIDDLKKRLEAISKPNRNGPIQSSTSPVVTAARPTRNNKLLLESDYEDVSKSLVAESNFIYPDGRREPKISQQTKRIPTGLSLVPDSFRDSSTPLLYEQLFTDLFC